MIFILIITIISTVLLALSNMISLWFSAAICLGCLAALAVIAWRYLQRRRLLKHRMRQCQAKWGSNVLHLGGLAVPLETQGLLMLTEEEMLFESDNLTEAFNLGKIISILPLTTDQFRGLTDSKICAILGSTRCQSLSSAREHVRRSSSGSIKSNTILLLHYQEGWQINETMSLVIIALEQKPIQTKVLFQNEKIRQVIKKYRPVQIKKNHFKMVK